MVPDPNGGNWCVRVSPLCDKYDSLSGDCLSCKDQGYTVDNGVCKQFTLPLAGCQERQRLGYGPCVGAEIYCKLFNLVSLNCVECLPGFFMNFQGVCQQNPSCAYD